MNETQQPIDLKALAAFIAVVECRGVTAARTRVNMSQSAISMHLANLEEQLGVSLCRRGRAGFALTKEGQRFYESGLHLLQAVTEFRRDVENIKWQRSVLSGTLRIGLGSDLPESVMAAMSATMSVAAAKHPQLRFDIACDQLPALENAVGCNRMDVALGAFDGIGKNLTQHHLVHANYGLYCAPSHPAAAEKQSLARLNADYVWVHRVNATNPGSGLNGGLATVAAHDVRAALPAVLAGTHLSYLPEYLAQPYVARGQLCVLLPGEAVFSVSYGAIVRSAPDPRANWFLNQLTANL